MSLDAAFGPPILTVEALEVSRVNHVRAQSEQERRSSRSGASPSGGGVHKKAVSTEFNHRAKNDYARGTGTGFVYRNMVLVLGLCTVI